MSDSVHAQIRADLESYLDSNLDLPSDKALCQILADKFDRTTKTVQNILAMVRADQTPETPSEASYRFSVSLSDVHIPFEDKKALASIEEFLVDTQPDDLILNGDFIDAYSISSFPTDPRKPLLQEELDQARAYLERWRKKLPNTKIVYLDGNHDQRAQRIKHANTGLYGLRCLEIPNLLDLSSLDIDYYEYMDPYQIGEMVFVHGNRISKHSAYSAKATITDGGFPNVMIGHVHRMGMYVHTGYEGTRRAYEQGHLCDVDQADYISNPNWATGFGVVYHDSSDQLIDVRLVGITDGRFIFNGKIYGGQ